VSGEKSGEDLGGCSLCGVSPGAISNQYASACTVLLRPGAAPRHRTRLQRCLARAAAGGGRLEQPRGKPAAPLMRGQFAGRDEFSPAAYCGAASATVQVVQIRRVEVLPPAARATRPWTPGGPGSPGWTPSPPMDSSNVSHAPGHHRLGQGRRALRAS
jgi:hypothetical protein